MSLLFLDKNYNSYNIEQRLLQKIGYSNIYNYIRELSYLGFEYSFLYPLVLTLQSTKGYFFTLPLLRINEYTNYSFSVKEYTLLYHNTTSTKLSNNYHYYNKLTSSSLPLYSFLNSLHTLIYTGAKANFSQLYQLIGIRGYLSGASKTRFNLPVLNNFNKGLNIFEYFISCLGARKGVIDTAIKTADSGYLTKRLVETTQGLIVKEYYCGTKNFCAYTSMINALGHSTFPSNLLLYGKILKTNVINLRTKEIITPKNTFLNPELLALLRVNKHKLSKLNLSSIKLCTLERTICSLCLGATTLSNNFLSRYIGIYVGQTVGEPSTQLTLRTFHTGGVSTLQTLKQQQTQETLLTYLPMNKYKICSFFKYFNLSTSPKIKTIKKLKKGSYNFLSFKRTYIKQAKINWIYLINFIHLFHYTQQRLDHIHQRHVNKQTFGLSFSLTASTFRAFNILVKTKYKEWVYLNVHKTLILSNYSTLHFQIRKDLISFNNSVNNKYCVLKISKYKQYSFSSTFIPFLFTKSAIFSAFNKKKELKLFSYILLPLNFKKFYI